jgi:hypothetical protein
VATHASLLASPQCQSPEWDYSTAVEAEYQREFRALGLDIDSLASEEAARRVRSRAIQPQLVAALDHWTQLRRIIAAAPRPPNPSRSSAWSLRPLLVARAADPDQFRNRVRQVIERDDWSALVALARSAEAARLPASTLCLVAFDLYRSQGGRHKDVAIRLLQRAQSERPGDFWITYVAADYLLITRQVTAAELLPYCTAAVALRPNDATDVDAIGGVGYIGVKVHWAIECTAPRTTGLVGREVAVCRCGSSRNSVAPRCAAIPRKGNFFGLRTLTKTSTPAPTRSSAKSCKTRSTPPRDRDPSPCGLRFTTMPTLRPRIAWPFTSVG